MKQAVSASFLILLVPLALCIPCPASGGTIKTDITCQYAVKRSGTIRMEVDISNTGNTTAYDVTATIFIGDWIKKYQDLGDNPPRGKICFKSRHLKSELIPGKYTAVIKVGFEEQTGRLHHVYHIFDIPYFLDRTDSFCPRLSLRLEPVCINKKTPWKEKEKFLLFMKNDHKGRIKPHVCFYLPDGFSTPESVRSFELDPGQENIKVIPLHIDPLAARLSLCHAVIWYDHNGIHYSHHLEAMIQVEERPAYFNWYLILGAVLLVILFSALAIRNRRGVSSRQ